MSTMKAARDLVPGDEIEYDGALGDVVVVDAVEIDKRGVVSVVYHPRDPDYNVFVASGSTTYAIAASRAEGRDDG